MDRYRLERTSRAAWYFLRLARTDYTLSMNSILHLSATAVANNIADGTLSSEEYCTALSEAITAWADLNAYSTFDPYHLMTQARKADDDLAKGRTKGPLHGVPLIIKDNINTFDLPTSGGTPALKGNIPASNAPIAQKLLDAGGLLAGKANMHELSSGGTSANHVFGRVRNPYDVTRTPGGSSGGTAAAVAARLAPAGLGTDTAGSVRVPASLCGLYGFRPTVGRYDAHGIVPLSTSLDTAGPLARSIDDIILLDSILADHANPIADRDITSIRLGVAEHLLADSSTEVQDVCQNILAAWEKAGATFVRVDLLALRDLQKAAAGDVIDVEFPGIMQAYLEEHAPHVTIEELAGSIASPDVKAFTRERLSKTFDMEAYAQATGPALKTLQNAWSDLLAEQQLDAITFTTTPQVALPWAEDDSVLMDGESVFSWFYFRHTGMGSTGRRPGISLPVGMSNSGLPVGMELSGLPKRDNDLLSVASAVSKVLEPLPAPAV